MTRKTSGGYGTSCKLSFESQEDLKVLDQAISSLRIDQDQATALAGKEKSKTTKKTEDEGSVSSESRASGVKDRSTDSKVPVEPSSSHKDDQRSQDEVHPLTRDPLKWFGILLSLIHI